MMSLRDPGRSSFRLLARIVIVFSSLASSFVGPVSPGMSTSGLLVTFFRTSM